MEKVGYRRLLSQKIDHAEFMEKMNEFNPESIDENQKESLLELLDYVASWLVEHILKKDKLIGEI
jgi:hemerythrin